MLEKDAMEKLQAIITKCWEDDAYKKAFLEKPADTMKAAGIDTKEGITYQVIEAPQDVNYIVLPCKSAKEALEECVHDLLKAETDVATSLDAGFELRLIQNKENTKYIILPPSPKSLSSNNLKQVVGGLMYAQFRTFNAHQETRPRAHIPHGVNR